MKILVSGCGKLGSMLAGYLSSLGHDVYVHDLDMFMVAACIRGESPFHDKCDMSKCKEYARQPIDVNMIVVPTPSLEDGSFDYRYVHRAIKSNVLNVIVSTLSVGTTDRLSKITKQQLVYMPTMIALGSINFERQRWFAGVSDWDLSNIELHSFLENIVGKPVYIVRWAEAELAKISMNGFFTTKISFANATAMRCDELLLNHERVLGIIGRDPRIGDALLKGGHPYGGPCFPRDTAALGQSNPFIAEQMISNQRINADLVQRRFVASLKGRQDVETYGIVGMSYKEGVPYDYESYGMQVAAVARAHDLKVSCYCHDCPNWKEKQALEADVIFITRPGLDRFVSREFLSNTYLGY